MIRIAVGACARFRRNIVYWYGFADARHFQCTYRFWKITSHNFTLFSRRVFLVGLGVATDSFSFFTMSSASACLSLSSWQSHSHRSLSGVVPPGHSIRSSPENPACASIRHHIINTSGLVATRLRKRFISTFQKGITRIRRKDVRSWFLRPMVT